MDLTEAWKTVDDLAQTFVAAIPRFVLAIVLAIFFYVVGRVVRALIEKGSHDDEISRRTLRIALGRIAHGAIAIIGLLVSITAAFPGFTPGNLIGTLGIGGVAIGFAFKDIFENFLAGILILVTRPFRIGDQIIYGNYEGTVEEIHTRATYLKTYDGRRVVVPNAQLFTNSVTVNTAFGTRRLEYDFKVGTRDDVPRARRILEQVLADAEDVLPDPRADVVVTSFDGITTTLRARWWSRSHVGDVLLAHDRVLSAARDALLQANVGLAAPVTHVVTSNEAESTAPEPALPKDQKKSDPERPT
ncbi:MAG TPA: mechanosensitive ion channel family protein, partial [Gemmatimonadaceae bacterium]|nr:mechanosensitive ion channel family protein [Gemmatimonadaceae bacterium]